MVYSRNLASQELANLRKMQEFIMMAHAESNSHDYSHVLSVCKYAMKIGKKIKTKVDPFVLCAGALLHDIGKTNLVFSHIHGLFGGALAEEFLDGLKVDPKMRDAVCRIVIRHTPTSMIPPESAVEWIVHDSDTLDRLGLIGLLRGFIGKTKYSLDGLLHKYIEKRRTDFDKLHFPESKEIGMKLQMETEAFIEIVEDRLRTRMLSIEHIFKKAGLTVTDD